MRQTGRTTRMLQEAIAQARNGRAVYVIAANLDHGLNLKRQAGPEAELLEIKFETPLTAGNFDWATLRLKGAHPNCLVLVDHYTIETYFAPILELLHRWDQP